MPFGATSEPDSSSVLSVLNPTASTRRRTIYRLSSANNVACAAFLARSRSALQVTELPLHHAERMFPFAYRSFLVSGLFGQVASSASSAALAGSRWGAAGAWQLSLPTVDTR